MSPPADKTAKNESKLEAKQVTRLKSGEQARSVTLEVVELNERQDAGKT